MSAAIILRPERKRRVKIEGDLEQKALLLLAAGRSQQSVARELGVAQSQVCRWLQRRAACGND